MFLKQTCLFDIHLALCTLEKTFCSAATKWCATCLKWRHPVFIDCINHLMRWSTMIAVSNLQRNPGISAYYPVSPDHGQCSTQWSPEHSIHSCDKESLSCRLRHAHLLPGCLQRPAHSHAPGAWHRGDTHDVRWPGVTWGRHPGQPRHGEGAGGGAGGRAGHCLGPGPAPWHAHPAHWLGNDHRLELRPTGKYLRWETGKTSLIIPRPIPDTTVTVCIGIREHFINITVGNLKIKWNIRSKYEQIAWKVSLWKLLSHWSQAAIIITNAQTLYRGISYLQLAFN